MFRIWLSDTVEVTVVRMVVTDLVELDALEKVLVKFIERDEVTVNWGTEKVVEPEGVKVTSLVVELT